VSTASKTQIDPRYSLSAFRIRSDHANLPEKPLVGIHPAFRCHPPRDLVGMKRGCARLPRTLEGRIPYATTWVSGPGKPAPERIENTIGPMQDPDSGVQQIDDRPSHRMIRPKGFALTGDSVPTQTRQAMASVISSPWTSVRRWSRPPERNVRRW